ncbi:MAG: transposase [Acidobacteriaceae bacterium]|nr:transposase [Acidobacteriaceae bacterium]
MPIGLHRYHQSQQTHFLTFSCYRREARFASPETYDLFLQCLEDMRRRFAMCVYGYVVMPEHVHLLVSEPGRSTLGVPDPASATRADLGKTLASAIRDLKVSFSKRLGRQEGQPSSFWQKRYYDRNLRDEHEFRLKLRYLHRNPVKRGLVNEPGDWKWSSFRHYALREMGPVEIESEWTARDRELSTRSPVFLCPG